MDNEEAGLVADAASVGTFIRETDADAGSVGDGGQGGLAFSKKSRIVLADA